MSSSQLHRYESSSSLVHVLMCFSFRDPLFQSLVSSRHGLRNDHGAVPWLVGALGARGRRRLVASNFLRTRGLAAELVRDAGVGANDLVLDLGAGTGRLTNELARTARHVVAVELDRKLAAGLRSRWANVELIEGRRRHGAITVRAVPRRCQLPFSRTNDLLHRLLDDPRTQLVRADLIVEWGVALKRALPWPSSVSSVLWGAFYESAVTRRLHP